MKTSKLNIFPLHIVFMVFFPFYSACNGVQKLYESRVQKEFQENPLENQELLTTADINHLPPPVQKYLNYVGVIGKPKLQNVRIEFDELMYKKPGASPMISSSVQYNFFKEPSRHFFMKASMMGIPFRVLHSYSRKEATMLVRVASLFNAVDIAGKDLTMAETVTVLNDICLLAPAALIHKSISWEKIDSFSSKVIFENGPYKVSAILYFNEKGELINFISQDRLALQDDGTLKKAPWSTPIRDYKEYNGIKLPSYGEAIWNYPEGDYVYGKFNLRKIEYNVKEFRD
jgi:hypothetical protein